MRDLKEIVVEEAPSTEAKATPPPTHADMFFRYMAALAQAAGVQAFTFAVAVPKEDGTSTVLSLAATNKDATREWQAEIAKLLVDSATKATSNITPPPVEEVN